MRGPFLLPSYCFSFGEFDHDLPKAALNNCVIAFDCLSQICLQMSSENFCLSDPSQNRSVLAGVSEPATGSGPGSRSRSPRLVLASWAPLTALAWTALGLHLLDRNLKHWRAF